ncbi:MAG: hypothetical protein E7513_07805 [Ruminococcaceae bacterium]|nr:hypothetical protein [Oscillospiraceae bacterium]
MSWITDLIDKMPELIPYIAPGFLLVNSFMWVLKKKFNNATVQIVSSVICSYFIWTLCKNIFPIDSNWGLLIITGTLCTILGLISGKIYKSSFFNLILCKLKLDRTTNDSIVEDCVGNNAWIAVFDEEQQKYYCGQYKYGNIEGDSNYVSLVTYYITDSDKKIIEDHTQEPKRKLLININNYKTVIISPNDPLDTEDTDDTDDK